MIFKRFSKIKKQDLSSETTRQKVLRFLVIGILFALVAWGVGENTKKQQRYAVAQWKPVFDATETLTPSMVQQLERYTEQFKKTYGSSLCIRIHKDRLHAVANRDNTIYLDICPVTQEISFLAPPLVLAALGHDLAAQLQGPKFPFWFSETEWPVALSDTLNRITARLDSALLQHSSQGTSPAP